MDLLIRLLANAALWWADEQVYRTIFGSQIFALKQMNATGPVMREQLEGFYNVAKGNFPDVYATYFFDQWLGYLISMGLIKTPDGGQHFSITDEGRDFLKWMMDARVLETKLL
jgi:hypothetical protein